MNWRWKILVIILVFVVPILFVLGLYTSIDYFSP